MDVTIAATVPLDTEFKRGLGLFDSTMVVVGSMIGSGIFLVSAEMARLLGSPGWLLVSWGIAGVLTIAAALSYGELAAMMPRAGGQYVYLRDVLSALGISVRLDVVHGDPDRDHRSRGRRFCEIPGSARPVHL
jgi:amino acid permease